MFASLAVGLWRYKRNCLRDSWFVLDTILVLFMVTETWATWLGGREKGP